MFLNRMESNAVSCKLRIPKNVNGRTPVFLVDFPNGNLNIKHSNEVKFSSYIPISSTEENINAKRILCAKSVLKYTSKSDEISSNGNKFNYFVGVRNKTSGRSGRIKIYQSTSYHLKPDLGNHITTSSEVKSYRERNEEVDSLYASKGKKRAIQTSKKLSVISSSVEEAIQNISLNKSVEDENQSPSTPASSNIDYLPPRNSDAQSVDEVYEVIDIISSVEDEYVKNAADELLTSLPDNLSEWKKDGTFCDYVLKHLEDGDIGHLKAKYLIYLNYLVSFSKLLSSDFKKKDPAQHIPEPLRSFFFDRFTSSSRTEHGKIVRNFPLKMKDKLLAYILVVALFIDDYLINLTHVQRGTKYGLPKITTIAQALGCHIQRKKIDNSNVPIAQLKLPLYVYRKHK